MADVKIYPNRYYLRIITGNGFYDADDFEAFSYELSGDTILFYDADWELICAYPRNRTIIRKVVKFN